MRINSAKILYPVILLTSAALLLSFIVPGFERNNVGTVFLCLIIAAAVVLFVKCRKPGQSSNSKIPLQTAIVLVVFYLALSIVKPPLKNCDASVNSRFMCNSNLTAIYASIKQYARQNAGRLPDPRTWCDELLTSTDLKAYSLKCCSADTWDGESAYAININVAGRKLQDIPADMVVLFETDSGKTDTGRTAHLKDRGPNVMFQFISKYGDPNRQWHLGMNPVYEQRWNQNGGPQLLTCGHHVTNGRGSNILFGDGTVKLIFRNDFDSLRWK